MRNSVRVRSTACPLPERPADVEAELERTQPELDRLRLLLGGIRQRALSVGDDLDALHQDREAPRLVDEVDCAAGERRLLVDVIAEAGEEDDRCHDPTLTQLAQHLEAIHARHAPVQQYQVGGFTRSEMFQGRGAAGEGGDAESLVLQVEAEELAEIILVVHQYDPRGSNRRCGTHRKRSVE